ncbi:MAG TPA: M20/M25/M40 family metallo-hydrolase [Terriglobales bacterium]|nr:M20/M25/M40 family metallo-hydrolase [Terriglobales bacterium]
MRFRVVVLLYCCCFCLLSTGVAHGQANPYHLLAHNIFQQLIEINTTDSTGNVTTAAEAMAQRFRDAGFPASDIQVLGPNDRKKNLVVRLHGTGANKPILLNGHLDVVEARREDWSTDPFQFVDKDDFYYGRGTQDMKSSDAILVTELIHFYVEGYKPDRDLILALTADEEGGSSNGVDWLLRNHRELIDADFVLNPDNGAVDTLDGKPVDVEMDATEKLYADYRLEVTNPGGHSSLPLPDNAIYRLTGALARLQRYQFPFELSAVTRGYFSAMSGIVKGQRSADMKAIVKTPPDAAAEKRLSASPEYNALLRTTCIPTRLDAGHANNALPQRATANVNCRILPGHSREEVRQKLVSILNDPKISVRYVNNAGEVRDVAPDDKGMAPVSLRPDVMQPLQQVVKMMWNVPVVPSMNTGASDAVYTNAAGMPTYGITGVGIDVGDVRAHGRDERVRAQSFYEGLDFYYRFLKALTGTPVTADTPGH